MERGTDFAAVFDEHMGGEFARRDLEATMATMSDEPHVYHVPVMTGGVGSEGGPALLRAPLHRQVARGHGDHTGLAHGG
jgi:hypothetical protein